MNKGKVELRSFNKSNKELSYEYQVKHNNGETNVEQLMTISSDDGLCEPAWIAQIDLSDFPPQPSPEQAALKLADWLERLGASIRIGDYQKFSPAEYQDIK